MQLWIPAYAALILHAHGIKLVYVDESCWRHENFLVETRKANLISTGNNLAPHTIKSLFGHTF